MTQRVGIPDVLLRCLAAVAAVAGAYALRHALSLATGPGLPPFIIFYPAVLIFAFFSGIVPGIVATGLAAGVTSLWILPADGAHGALQAAQWVSLALFTAMGMADSLFSELYRQTRRRADSLRELLYRQQGEERAREIVDVAPDSIFIQTGGRFAYLNPAACRLFGISTPEELIGTPVVDRVHPDYRAAARERISRLNDKREAVSDVLEQRFLRQDGSEVWVETVGQPIVHQGLNGALVFVRDISSRKEAESQKAQIERHFKLLAETSPVGIAITDMGGRMQYLSPYFIQMVGYTLEDVPTVEEWFRFSYPVEGERIRIRREWNDEIRNARDQGRPAGPLEYTVRCKDGAVREIEFRMASARDLNFVVLADVTERKESERVLRDSEERFRGTLESMLEGFQILGSDWRYRYINAAAERHNRRPKEELLGNRYMDMWPGIESTNVFAVIRRSLEERVPQTMENEFTFPDGKQGWYELRISPVSEGVAIFSADISERKHSEQEVRDNQMLLQTVIDLVPHFIFAKDRSSRHLFVNRACAAANGLTPKQMIGLRDIDVAPDGSQAEGFMRDDREVIEGNRARANIEELLTDHFGKTRVLSTTKIPFVLPGSTERALLGVAVDITELKQAEEQVRQLNTDLERRVQERTAELAGANKELEAFAYAVSHDLRAPLRALSGFSQALREDHGEKLDGEAGEYLDQITSAAARMGELIDGILQLSRVTRGELRRENVDLTSMARSVLEVLQRTELSRHVSATVEPGLVTYGDARLIRAVLENLLGNAWKYTSRAERAEIRMYEERDGDEPRFCVADNGAGFDIQHQARLFQPFQRLHRQDEFPGIGIGLATVSRIIQRHGGTLRAEGTPGKGAIFSFSLPTNRGIEPAPPAGNEEL